MYIAQSCLSTQDYLLHGHSRIFGPAQQLSTDALLDVLRVNMLSEQLYHCIFQLSVLLDLLIILLIDGGFPWSWGFRCGVHMLLAIQLQDAENAVAWWIANDYNDGDIDWNRSSYSITFRSVKCLPKQLWHSKLAMTTMLIHVSGKLHHHLPQHPLRSLGSPLHSFPYTGASKFRQATDLLRPLSSKQRSHRKHSWRQM